ncbi:outer membrane beta-barrel protein [Litorilituus sediminis]|uniref:Outer membrane protein beta-barrel domain-containing protein n=1 Tax=Litorilituus sediminis TaxID=718192 RepID=A0A4P6P381_9GAMM|nr:outer membrane beta-barrel protein [Litorilituus sediminis]QBG35753.1 hypothetical protein EMK97_08530 [Litorilituus sediminis]
MHKILIPLLMLSTSFSSAANSYTADTYYVGVDYMLTDIDISGENAKPGMTGIRFGASNNNIAFEAQYLISNKTDNIYRMEFDLENSKALYLVMQSDTMQGFHFDVALGYAENELAVTGPEFTYNGTEKYSGFSWNISIQQEIPFIPNTQVRLAYQSLFKNDDFDISGIALGLTYQF